ncbi:hypothetical protein AU381_09625 [Sinorhizobium glycinis]|uniref:Glucose-methanol-choline oxidoreductase C-terminal domain-containing protein n=1 Tax=Sinorhizobium glycinis TaxID=1472378 RepID=A0A178XXD7_9HYPH|nr:GMC family oxidoreductase [Sinorhizobium glycinis]OAP39804.1 hypothetical protein AU381_09625 [Sinorhizobium glycinis]
MAIVTRAGQETASEFDVCIVGAGASGLTIASVLAGKPIRVCVLESGGDRNALGPSELATGECSGLPYAPLDTSRLRGFGGSTRAGGWGGLCKPFDEQDFAYRPWVKDSGWPFGFEHLRPYYERAGETLGTASIDLLRLRDPVFANRSDRLASDNVALCRNLRLGERLRSTIEQSASTTVFLQSTALYLEFDNSRQNVTSVVFDAGGDRTLRITARAYVLAAGGLENARLLLLSEGPTGRQRDLIGRYFMDHPRFSVGTLVPLKKEAFAKLLSFDRIRIARRQRVERLIWPNSRRHYTVKGLALSFDAQREEQLLNHRAWVEPVFPGLGSEALEALKSELLFRRDLGLRGSRKTMVSRTLDDFRALNWAKIMHMARPAGLARSFRLQHIVEPEPCADSAVKLSQVKDRFGLNKIDLHWRISDATLRSLRRTFQILQAEFLAAGAARLVATDDEWEQLERPMWTWHHIGTTRMHEDPHKGVVDAQCKAHSVNNLFVAGSSVFPTAGNDTPTFTAVALSHRLADLLLHVVCGARRSL